MMPTVVSAANNINGCFDRVVGEMTAAHDQYRAYLFGARRDRDNKITVLTGGEYGETKTGIFETQDRLTSELIEPIVDSYRVYRCRSLNVCQVLGQSFAANGGTVDIRQLGCVTQSLERYPECYFAGQSQDGGDATLQSAATGLMERCRSLANDTLASERAILRLAVGYDAGYRSLLQFAGMMDWVLTGFPTQTVRAVADMVNLLGKLHQIPCFIGQCDAPDNGGINVEQ